MGSQADFPSHPELLDWMATEFIRRHWDMKAMVKLIVTSATYRQASQGHAAALAGRSGKSPAGPRAAVPAQRRVASRPGVGRQRTAEGEDRRAVGAALHAARHLGRDERLRRSAELPAEPGDGLYRRTLYTIWKRTAAPPTNLLFDAPTREICTVKRSRTNTPLQALAVLNEVTFVEASRKLAERMIAEGGATPEPRLAYGFRLAAARQPRPEELKILTDGLKADLDRFHRDPRGRERS